MLTLIKREIRDNLLFILISVVLSALLVFMAFGFVYGEKDTKGMLSFLSSVVLAVSVLGLCAMGSSQMYADKNKKLSAFICTHAVTRKGILTTRIITGLLAVFILILPIFITIQVLLRIFGPPVPIYTTTVQDFFLTGFLMAFSCYCIGLQTGWSSNKIFPTLGAILLAIILLLLVIIKGFDFQIWIILTLFIIASLARTWNIFKNTALV